MKIDPETIYTEWQNNLEFREAFKKDPKKALETWGFELSNEDLEKILKFKNNNEKLDGRVNK